MLGWLFLVAAAVSLSTFVFWNTRPIVVTRRIAAARHDVFPILIVSAMLSFPALFLIRLSCQAFDQRFMQIWSQLRSSGECSAQSTFSFAAHSVTFSIS
jgi:hypothetical protein